MSEKKIETFIYRDLGFPIKLVNVPMKKIFGEWFLDINLGKLQKSILNELVNKPIPLTGAEIRFIRKYFEMTTTEFGHLLGTTHAAVLKWEKGESRMNPATEFYMRLYVLDRLRTKDREFRKFYHQITLDNFSKHRKGKDKIIPLEIDANEELLAFS
jgi:DNA-binding transcriptional regulator YiaG